MQAGFRIFGKKFIRWVIRFNPDATGAVRAEGLSFRRFAVKARHGTSPSDWRTRRAMGAGHHARHDAQNALAQSRFRRTNQIRGVDARWEIASAGIPRFARRQGPERSGARGLRRAASAGNFRTDVDASGSITATDVSQVKLASGTALPRDRLRSQRSNLPNESSSAM